MNNQSTATMEAAVTEQIGAAAGAVWQFLRDKGPATATQIQKGTKLDTAVANQAIGWLAREGKVRAEKSKRTITFTLTE